MEIILIIILTISSILLCIETKKCHQTKKELARTNDMYISTVIYPSTTIILCIIVCLSSGFGLIVTSLYKLLS